MIRIGSNLDEIVTLINSELEQLDIDKMTKEQATTIMAKMRERIHERGQASDGSSIGTYTSQYLKIRNGTTSRKGVKRMSYNRGTNPNVILSLTRQMESDMIVIPVEKGHGIGYSNKENYNKKIWNEKRYGKDIFSLSEEEEGVAEAIAERYVNELEL